MNFILLNQATGIWKPFAWVIGKIFNAIYEFISLMSEGNAANVAVCLIILTIVVKLLMTPFSIKQQKYTKLQSVISPELNAISAKYKGKTDEESKRRMVAEQQALYEKYGTSPTAGCLPMLITIPIMFGLYRVIYAIPAYVSKIYAMFEPIATEVQKITTEVSVLKEGFIPSTSSIKDIIDILNSFNSEKWAALSEALPDLSALIQTQSQQILKINEFLGLNLLDTPLTVFPSFALLIPILSVATQFLQTKLAKMGQPQQKPDPDNTMAQSLNSMTTFMPILSGVFCLMFPICIGIYWIINTVVSIAQTLVINLYIDRKGIDQIIAANLEKQRKKREKLGISTSASGRMAELAKTQTKSIDSTKKSVASYAGASSKKDTVKGKNESLQDEQYKTNKASASSISDYANLLKRKNEEE